jgi:hypothetical protein
MLIWSSLLVRIGAQGEPNLTSSTIKVYIVSMILLSWMAMLRAPRADMADRCAHYMHAPIQKRNLFYCGAHPPFQEPMFLGFFLAKRWLYTWVESKFSPKICRLWRIFAKCIRNFVSQNFVSTSKCTVAKYVHRQLVHRFTQYTNSTY